MRLLALPPWVTGSTAEYGATDLDGVYRYRLTRWWQKGTGTLNIVMLNPSAATHLVDDPTIRRCEGYARSWGYQRLTVTNLFGYRAAAPAALRRAAATGIDPIGPDNDWHLRDCAHEADRVLVAWGTHGALLGRARVVLPLLTRRDEVLCCLGITRNGQPKHPLYLRSDLTPRVYSLGPRC